MESAEIAHSLSEKNAEFCSKNPIEQKVNQAIQEAIDMGHFETTIGLYCDDDYHPTMMKLRHRGFFVTLAHHMNSMFLIIKW